MFTSNRVDEIRGDKMTMYEYLTDNYRVGCTDEEQFEVYDLLIRMSSLAHINVDRDKPSYQNCVAQGLINAATVIDNKEVLWVITQDASLMFEELYQIENNLNKIYQYGNIQEMYLIIYHDEFKIYSMRRLEMQVLS